MEENKDIRIENEETGSSRRGFLKKGAIVSAPLVLTAFSRPVFALRCGLSGLQSGNLSGQDEFECVGGGSPGYWKNRRNEWPYPLNSGECTQNTGNVNNVVIVSPYPLFNSADGFPASSDNRSMLQVFLDDEGSTESHALSALLNYYYYKQYPTEGTYALSLGDIRYLYSVGDTSTIEDTYTWD